MLKLPKRHGKLHCLKRVREKKSQNKTKIGLC